MLVDCCRVAGLERRPASRRTVGSGIGPDPQTSGSSCGSETMSPLALGSPAIAPTDQHHMARRLNSLLGSASRGSISSTLWWNAFVRSPTVSSASAVSMRDIADGEESRRCASLGGTSGGCSCAVGLLTLVLLCLLVLIGGYCGGSGHDTILSGGGEPHTIGAHLLDTLGSEGGGQQQTPSTSCPRWLMHGELAFAE
jgi:hypothetical protein